MGLLVGPGLYGIRTDALFPEGGGGQDGGNEAPGLECLLHLPIELCFAKHKLREKITAGQ